MNGRARLGRTRRPNTGGVDVSVLIRDPMDRQLIRGAQGSAQLNAGKATGAAVTVAATPPQATTKLLHAALVDLPAPGTGHGPA